MQYKGIVKRNDVLFLVLCVVMASNVKVIKTLGFQPKKYVYGSPRETIVKCLFIRQKHMT